MRLRPCMGSTIAAVAAWTMLVSCAPAKVTTTASPALEQYRIRSVVIMPFDRLTTPQIIDSPEFFPGQRVTTVPDYAPDKIAQIVSRKLGARQDIHVIVPTSISAEKREGGGALEQQAKEAMRRMGVDAALLGRVLIYREREGARWGGTPAVVGFEVKLIAPNGVTLWTGNYYERQRPMIEDFTGFWQHGGGFATADELARYGAERIVREFPVGAWSRSGERR